MKKDRGKAQPASSLIDQRLLIYEFRWQFIGRSLGAGLTVSIVIGALLLLTSGSTSWWFTTASWLAPIGQFLRESKPWDLFVYLFLASVAVSFVGRFADGWYERHNFVRLRDLARQEIARSSNPAAVRRSERVLLGIRRLTLHALMREATSLAELLALSIWMLVVGLPLSALLTVAIGSSAVLLQPWLTRRFAARRPQITLTEERTRRVPLNEIEDLDERRRVRAERLAARPDDSARLEAQYTSMEQRLGAVADRSLFRLAMGWPIIAGLAVGAAVIAVETVLVMASGDGPGSQAVILLAILALTGRGTLALAHSVEEVAFFASGSTTYGSEPE